MEALTVGSAPRRPGLAAPTGYSHVHRPRTVATAASRRPFAAARMEPAAGGGRPSPAPPRCTRAEMVGSSCAIPPSTYTELRSPTIANREVHVCVVFARAGIGGGYGRDELARHGRRGGGHHGAGGQRHPRGGRRFSRRPRRCRGRRRNKDPAAPRDGAAGALRRPIPVPPGERGEYAAEHPREDRLGQGRRGLEGTFRQIRCSLDNACGLALC
jgi:hypothetical protein